MSVTFLAVSLLAQAVAAVPGSCDATRSSAFANEARRASAARDFSMAAGKFQKAYTACPQNPSLLVEKARSLLMAGKFGEAAAASDILLQTNPGHAAALKIKGNAQYFSGHYDQAMTTFVTLLDVHPTDEEGAYMLGRIYYQEGRVEQAIGQFQRVLKQDPSSFKAWDNLGLCWRALGNYEKAIAHFLQAIKLAEANNAPYDLAYANLADLLVQTGDAERAYAAAAKAANRNPESARNFYIGAKALEKLGKIDLCLNWLQRATALDPGYAEPLYLLIRVYHRLGEHDKAEDARQKFLAIRAKEPNQRR
jgi:tetratricopeptide (TPR) repeat protein